MASGEIAGASSAYQESLETFRKNGENSKAAYPLVGIGDVYSASGDFANAKKSYEESLAISRETGEKHESAVALGNLGSLAMQQGDLAAARKNYLEAINLRNEIGEKSGAAEFSLCWPAYLSRKRHPSEAEALARKALEEFRAAKISESADFGACRSRPGSARARKIETGPGAKSHLGKPLAAKTQQRLLRLQFEIAAAEVLAASGKPADFQAATASLKAVIQEAEKKGIRGPLYEARLALGKAEMQHGNKEDGRARLADVEKEAGASGFVLIRKKAATAL